MTSPEAICELLSRPDEPTLAGKRIYHLTQQGIIECAEDIKRDLATAYVQYRMESHREVFSVSVRRIPGLKIVRRR